MIEFANATGRRHRPVATQLHEVQPHEPEVDHLARDAADLHTISDADAVLADQEEISDQRDQHALHRDCETGGDESGKRRE